MSGDVYRTTDPLLSASAVHLAIENGINFFDSSPYYGLTLAEERLQKGTVGKRHKVVLVTKCGRHGLKDFDFFWPSELPVAHELLRRLLATIGFVPGTRHSPGDA